MTGMAKAELAAGYMACHGVRRVLKCAGMVVGVLCALCLWQYNKAGRHLAGPQ